MEQKRQQLLKQRDKASRFRDKETQREAIIEYHQAAIKSLTDNILSNKYINDHIGYVSDLGAVQAHQASLDAFEASDKAYADAIKKLEELDGWRG